ncbi:hypothetical protein ONZ45_g1894 [Pleurotus djamor]|nr:hypothetical protein ONZ45_g1894 [Pleurotus djamor]
MASLGTRTILRPWMFLHVALVTVVSALQLHNGQMVTDGFSIINSPQPETPVHDNIVISVDVTANGKLQQPSAIDSLEIYLISSEKNLNLTVTAGPDFLQGEQGSTVKHLNFRPPSCATDGRYNLTFYEASHTGDEQYFIVSSIPVIVDNTANSDTPCNTNNVLSQPQASSPPPNGNPFLPSNPLQDGIPKVTSLPGITTVTVASGSTFPGRFLPTMTYEGPSNPTMTVVVVSQVGVPTTGPDGPTTVEVETSTTTTMTMSDLGAFLPVSGSRPRWSLSTIYLPLVGLVVGLLLRQ